MKQHFFFFLSQFAKSNAPEILYTVIVILLFARAYLESPCILNGCYAVTCPENGPPCTTPHNPFTDQAIPNRSDEQLFPGTSTGPTAGPHAQALELHVIIASIALFSTLWLRRLDDLARIE